MTLEIFTIGHSTHPLPRFMAHLGMHAIELVCDVRSTPYSRFNPQFNREALQATLTAGGIDYLYLGSALGGKPRDRADRGPGRQGPGYPTDETARFALIAKSDRFRAGLARLLAEARMRRVAIMCAEQDPARCHRGLLICPSLPAEVTVHHILADGSLREGLAGSTPATSDDHGQQALF